MIRIGIIIGSTRPGRKAEAVARWVFGLASQRQDAEFEIVDILDYDLPLLDEPTPASSGPPYTKEHTRKWSEKIASFDAFIFVTPEYNHGVPAALKNAIDFLWNEWNNKAAGFVAYGSSGGVRSVEALRLTMAELEIADVRVQVELSLRTDFENYTVFKPDPRHEKKLRMLIGQLFAWGEAMRRLRDESARLQKARKSA